MERLVIGGCGCEFFHQLEIEIDTREIKREKKRKPEKSKSFEWSSRSIHHPPEENTSKIQDKQELEDPHQKPSPPRPLPF